MIVDAHEDLAWNMATFGRDYTRSAAETRSAEADTHIPARNGQSVLGLADWRAGGVGLVFGTLYAGPRDLSSPAWEGQIYDDLAGAHRMYWEQLQSYWRLFDEHPDDFVAITDRAGLRQHRSDWQAAEPEARRVGIVPLMEGADGILDPDEVEAWFDAGLRVIGPTWMQANRYAGGTRQPGPLTPDGRRLLDRMAETGLILDVSHLAEQSALQALEHVRGGVIASHSNPRALVPNIRFPERHLSDATLRALFDHRAVVGIVLGNRFLKDNWTVESPRDEVTLDDIVAHIDYVCQLAGSAQFVGLGSDFDGGFGLEQLPQGFESVADLGKIGVALNEHGYSPDDVDGILGGNWLRLLDTWLPEA
jgi:membrane dipeptidase